MVINFTPQRSASASKLYFSRADYLGAEKTGLWCGKLAEQLGLSGTVNKTWFDLLCDNRRPTVALGVGKTDGNEERLTPYDVQNRIVGMDVTFNAPKSFSLLYQHTGDVRIMALWRRCVAESMAEIEADMCQPFIRDGVQHHPVTGNILAAEFIHLTARPVEGIPDPHLHTHMFVFNATRNPEDGVIRSGHFRRMKEQASLHEARFHARLAYAVQHELGIRVSLDGKGFWRVSGVPHAMDKTFSRRTEKIEEMAAKMGIAGNKAQVAKLAKITREAKETDLPMAELHRIWNRMKGFRDKWAMRKIGKLPLNVAVSADQAVRGALEHELVTQSAVPHRELLISAIKQGLGSCTVADIERELEHDRIGQVKRVKDGVVYFTTREVVAQEQQLLEASRNGRGACRRLGVDGFEINDTRVAQNREQHAAVEHVFRSNDRIISIEGGAGVGKTTLMREVVRGVEEGLKQVIPLAPTNDAVGKLQEDGFSAARSLAGFVKDVKAQRKAKGQVIWVDESGLVSVPQMLEVVKLAETLDARLVLTGDERQHKPVGRGDALRLMHQHGGLEPARVRTIVRQKNAAFREAVHAISTGQVVQGFERLDRLGSIVEFPVQDGVDGFAKARRARHKAVAAGYVGMADSRDGMVIAPTRAEGRELTQQIRAALKRDGRLGEEQKVLRLEQTGLTEEQRSHAAYFRSGMVVQLHQKASGCKIPEFQLKLNSHGQQMEPEPFPTLEKKRGRPRFVGYSQGATERGCRLTVVGRDEEGHVYGKDQHGKLQLVPIWDAAKFVVYEQVELPLAPGDALRITGNGWSKDRHRLTNKMVRNVAAIHRNGDIRLSNGWVLAADFGHIDHGYVRTSVSSQGSDVNRVFISQGVESGRAVSMEQLYVSVSRAKEWAQIYTDDKARLLEMVRRDGSRVSATELMADGQAVARAVEPPCPAYTEMVGKHWLIQVKQVARETAQMIREGAGKAQQAAVDLVGKVREAGHLAGEAMRGKKLAAIGPGADSWQEGKHGAEDVIKARKQAKSHVERVEQERKAAGGSRDSGKNSERWVDRFQTPRFAGSDAADSWVKPLKTQTPRRSAKRIKEPERFTDRILSNIPEIRSRQLEQRAEKQAERDKTLLDKMAGELRDRNRDR